MTTTAVTVPLDLAPSLADRLRQLLAEVPIAAHPPFTFDPTFAAPRCVVCFQGGKLTGHHGDVGIEWVHKACHRHIHRRGELSRSERRRVSGRARRLLPLPSMTIT